MRTRGWSSVLVALALVAGLAPVTTGVAGGVPPIGPLKAQLAPPSTYYVVQGAKDVEALGGDDWDYLDWGTYWDLTTAGDPSPAEVLGHDPEPQSCGYFYPNSAEEPVPAAGRPTGDDLVYSEDEAVWDHPNGDGPGTCPHGSGTSHPGIVYAEAWEEYYPNFSQLAARRMQSAGVVEDPIYPALPREAYLCEYVGSESGEGPPCELVPEPTTSFCRILRVSILIRVTAAVTFSLIGNQLTADLGGGRTCTASTEELQNVFILGGDGDDDIEINYRLLKRAKFGFNLGGGTNTLTINATSERDSFGLHGFPAFQSYPAGLAFDIDADDVPDSVASYVSTLYLDLKGGKDTTKVFPAGLYSMLGNYGWSVNGGAGLDTARLLPGTAGSYNLGSGPAQRTGGGGTPTAFVNLNSDQDEIADMSAVGVERWTTKGTSGTDIFTGAGGAGTGGPFRFPIEMSGAGGNDTLTGGDKGDVLKGGPGSNDVCKGGKGTDEATGCETTSGIPRPSKLVP